MDMPPTTPTRKVMRAQLHQAVGDSGIWCKGISIHRKNLEKIAHEILELNIEDPNYQVLPSNDTMVYKHEILHFLQDYRYFNPQKFAELNDYCLMEDILFSLDLPKYELDTPYFIVGGITPQPATYSAAEVGDSDDEFENTQFTQFTLDRPLKAGNTSIWCQDGPIKGDMLIYNCQAIIFSQLNEWHEFWEGMGNDGTILRNLGNYMYEYSACSEKQPRQKNLDDEQVISQIIHPGHNVAFQLIALGPTSRLVNPQFHLCDFIVPQNLEKGFAYKEINEINQEVLTYLSKVLGCEHSCSNQVLAKLQLARLKDTEYQPDAVVDALMRKSGITNKYHLFNSLIKEHYTILEKDGVGLMVWLDYLNTLIFKVEASRINTTVISGLMMLQLIEHGHLTYKTAFYDNPSFLGQFPGASIATTHNFKTRAQLLTYEGFLGMKTDRQHPRWLMCTLKESIMMLNWFKIFVLQGKDPKNFTRNELLQDFTTHAHVMMQTYLRVASEM